MNKYKVLGLMSGTSLDGVDLASCTFIRDSGKWTFKIDDAQTVRYTNRQKRDLEKVNGMTAEEFSEAHVSYGRYLGQLAKAFVEKRRLKVDFVSSHGHTIFHQPHRRFTTQVGDGAALSAASGFPVVCDFRTADVALGGQGAPLVPIGDRLLFSEYTYCLNLGGIANISYEMNKSRIAFDICPVNLILNPLASSKGKAYDEGGRMAGKGKIDGMLLKKLNAVSFYRKKHPKSLGREDIENHFLHILQASRASTEDKLRTCCEHIAMQIGRIAGKKGRMLITGGGAYNTFLAGRIQACCKPEVVIPGSTIVEFKEALIFAFLGVLRWRNEINTLASVTGAERDSCGGAIYHP